MRLSMVVSSMFIGIVRMGRPGRPHVHQSISRVGILIMSNRVH
jgi:hypothetical protein